MVYYSCTTIAFVAISGAVCAGDPTLPARVDLRPEFTKLGISAVAQGSRDTCSLFAITALVEFEIGHNTPGPHKRMSEEFLIWAANEATGQRGDQAMFWEAVQGLNTLGICTEELLPYAKKSKPRRKPSEAAIVDAKQRGDRWPC